ncbi:hypothetical protein SCNRRL3882_0089 [Streptomyces chartreusis NRRL 3882]|uniref:Uncharacterized protein n=1 Tax=Streptomyces chartreusis NRRL 3882 TaxID=1079985 RepID=A0A2N9AZV0_STRCX|nr:hypothetical protein SCNRRL3882_0089 [Streptomyces chartreusis NRRL 3882]
MINFSTPPHAGVPRPAGVFSVAPFAGETTSSLICRLATRYGPQTKALRSHWKWRNYRPQHEGVGGARADADVLLNAAGRQVLARLCGIQEETLTSTNTNRAFTR